MTELTGEDLIALRDSGFTPEEWTLQPWDAKFGGPISVNVIITYPDGWESARRILAVSPPLRMDVSSEAVTSEWNATARLAAHAPALLAYAIKADERVKVLEARLSLYADRADHDTIMINKLLLQYDGLSSVLQGVADQCDYVDGNTMDAECTGGRMMIDDDVDVGSCPRCGPARQALKGAE